MPSKADYVRAQVFEPGHTCHWPGCEVEVPPAMWGCRKHWYKLPKQLRQKLWQVYEPGQEIEGNPSEEYIEVAREIQAWIAENYDPKGE